jgi:hypothetical protein
MVAELGKELMLHKPELAGSATMPGSAGDQTGFGCFIPREDLFRGYGIRQHHVHVEHFQVALAIERYLDVIRIDLGVF